MFNSGVKEEEEFPPCVAWLSARAVCAKTFLELVRFVAPALFTRCMIYSRTYSQVNNTVS